MNQPNPTPTTLAPQPRHSAWLRTVTLLCILGISLTTVALAGPDKRPGGKRPGNPKSEVRQPAAPGPRKVPVKKITQASRSTVYVLETSDATYRLREISVISDEIEAQLVPLVRSIRFESVDDSGTRPPGSPGLTQTKPRRPSPPLPLSVRRTRATNRYPANSFRWLRVEPRSLTN